MYIPARPAWTVKWLPVCVQEFWAKRRARYVFSKLSPEEKKSVLEHLRK